MFHWTVELLVIFGRVPSVAVVEEGSRNAVSEGQKAEKGNFKKIEIEY